MNKLFKKLYIKYLNNNLSINILSSFICKGLAIILNFFIIPLTINILGNDYYGLWILILSTTSWIYTFDIGIGNGIKNKISENIAKKNKLEIIKIIINGYVGVMVIAIGILLFSIFIILNLDLCKLLNINFLSEKELEKILIINISIVCLNFILSLCNNIFNGLQKSYIASINNFLSQFIIFILCYGIYIYKINSIIIMSILYGGSIAFSNIIVSAYYLIKNFQRKRINLIKLISLHYIKNMVNIGGKIFIIQICGLVIFSTDNLIISRFLGIEDVGEYNIINKLFTIPTIFLTLMLVPTWPAITKAYYEKNKVWLENLLLKINKVWKLVFILTILLMIFGKNIVYMWTLKKIDTSISLIIIFGINTVLATYSSIYSTFLFAINPDFRIVGLSIFQAILNILLSYIFIIYLKIGMNGVILATVFCMSLNIYFLPKWVKQKICNMKDKE
ncbi:MAG: lipopolysaccharide biosynthesis protein [Cetobacterium sp.]|uniref:lipopolysaccharide biosynthesis protein n=1 Tax=Cetobacterium sp. TaxID=2071632 RepID=UPI003F3970BC